MKFEKHINDLILWSEGLGQLTAEEEKLCVQHNIKTKEMDEDCLWRLVNHNIRLILHFGKNIFNDDRTDNEEVFCAGMEALIHAAQKYDGTHRFSTYANHWLRNLMGQAGYGRRKEKEQGIRFVDIAMFADSDDTNSLDLLTDADEYEEKEYMQQVQDELEPFKTQIISECGFDAWRVWELRVGYEHSYKRIAKYIGLPEMKVRKMLEGVEAYIKPLAFSNSLFGGSF